MRQTRLLFFVSFLSFLFVFVASQEGNKAETEKKEAQPQAEVKKEEGKEETKEETKEDEETKAMSHLEEVLKEKEKRKFKLQKEREEADYQRIKLEEKTKEQILQLTSENFDTELKEGPWLVAFTTSTCEACKHLEVVWGRILLANTTFFKVAKVNLDKEIALGEKFNISNVPAIMLFNNGEALAQYETEQEKSVAAFQSFVHQMTGLGSDPNVDVITITKKNQAELEHGEWLVGFFVPWCPHCNRLADIWAALATATRGVVKVGKVNCAETKDLCEQYQVDEYPTVRFVDKKSQISILFRVEHQPVLEDFIKFLDVHLEVSPYSENFKGVTQIRTREELEEEACADESDPEKQAEAMEGVKKEMA